MFSYNTIQHYKELTEWLNMLNMWRRVEIHFYASVNKFIYSTAESVFFQHWSIFIIVMFASSIHRDKITEIIYCKRKFNTICVSILSAISTSISNARLQCRHHLHFFQSDKYLVSVCMAHYSRTDKQSFVRTYNWLQHQHHQ